VDAASDASTGTSFDATSDATSDATTATTDAASSTGCPHSSTDGGDAPSGCGWLSSSPSHAPVQGTLQLTAVGRDAGFGSVLDWNVTGGWGSGAFSNATATSATFTCLTPGPVIVTATDPAGTPCNGDAYDQASVTIQCDPILGPWASVSVGPVSACAIKTDGSARCWGTESLDGVLGDGTTTPSAFPVQVTGLTSGVSSVSAGDNYACALTTGGAVQCWGVTPGALGIADSLVPSAVAGLSTGVTAISVGWSSACALTASKGVLCWGENSSGQLGDGSTNASTTPVAVAGLTGSTAAVSVGGAFACAVSTTGVVQCWGADLSGELGNGAPTSTSSASPVAVTGLPAPATNVAAGDAFACAVTSAGDVYCWGANDRSQLGTLSAANSTTAVHIGGLPQDVRSVAAGQDFACALTSGGAVLCWGDDIYGELGSGSVPSAFTSTKSGTPVPVSGLTSGVAALSLGGTSACAVRSSGDLLCWGNNGIGQLANPTTTFCPVTNPASPCSPVPTLIETAGQAADCPSSMPDAAAPDAGSDWCQQQGSHTLCEDFDHGFPGQLTTHASAGSTLQADDDFQSPPAAMVATTSPISPLNVESTAWGSYVSPKAGASFKLQADFKVGSDCFANVSRAVTLARVDYLDVGYELAYSVSPATSGWGFVLDTGETETTPQTAGPVGPAITTSSFVPADQWARLTLWADLAGGGGTGGSSVMPLLPNASADAEGGGLFGPMTTPTSAPVLRIGNDAAAHGCTVHIDNVLFDVQ
jgi:alpha-tubulin suppressor-like RCC1 family protein